MKDYCLHPACAAVQEIGRISDVKDFQLLLRDFP